MRHDENDFSPLPEDSQVERLTAPGSQGEARLTQDLQAMYAREKSVSIERVWTRLVSQRAGTKSNVFATEQPGVLDSQKHHQFPERNVKMQHTDRTPTLQKGLPRFLGLLAAALVCAVLVGSLLLVLNATRSKIPTVGGSSPECRDNNNQSDQALCLAHAETILNIAKTFGTHKVTFVRAYADTTRLILIYTTTDSPHSDVISFTSLTIQQGITLTGGSSNSYENPQTQQWYYLINFDTRNVPARTTELYIQSIVDGFSGKATPLNFTLPLHTAQKTISVNMTVTSKGVSLTLERMVFAGSTNVVNSFPRILPSFHTRFV